MVFMAHFPAGKTIFDPNGGTSFCGYHRAFVNNGSRRSYYAALRDLASKPDKARAGRRIAAARADTGPLRLAQIERR
jgi:hypothetical protein